MPSITLDIIRENPDKRWDFENISKNTMIKGKNDFIIKEIQRWFSQSSLKEEMMAKIWHPRNIEKFKYLDPERFGGFGEEEEENN